MDTIRALDFTDLGTFTISFFLLFVIVFLRYLFLSSAYHWTLLIKYRKKLKNRILSARVPASGQIRKELLLSTYSALIFSITGMMLLILWQKGFTKLYADIDKYTLWYVPLSILLFLIIHDTYYYWIHRWMHRSKFMRNIHMEHHKSVHTTVFTSFSFHPVESLLQALIVPAIIMLIPMSTVAMFITLGLMTFSAIINHAGVEVYPAGKNLKIVKKCIIGATHHDYHHKNAKKNFGLYFTFWDRLMKTENR